MGLYGLKGSVARMPHAGLMGSHDGMDAIIGAFMSAARLFVPPILIGRLLSIPGALGPIARSARDLALFCRVMLQYNPWLVEPPLLEIPWKQDVADVLHLPDKLCFAILWDDGIVLPHPPILDAMKRTKDALVKAGHEVITWNVLDSKEAWELIVSPR